MILYFLLFLNTPPPALSSPSINDHLVVRCLHLFLDYNFYYHLYCT